MKSVKNVYGWMAVAVAMFGSAVSAQAVTVNSGDTREVVVSIGDVYIPSGFDSASDAFVVVNGLFPNTCYSWKTAAITHLSATDHEIRSIATVKEGICMMMLVPFQHEVQLGRLSRGKHMLRFVGGDGTYVQKQLTIE